MTLQTALTRRLNIDHPIIQAPMAGGGDTPELVAAVCEAGGLGFIGGAYLNAEQISQAAAAVKARTQRPFGINLFAPLPAPSTVATEVALERVAAYYAELGLQPPSPPTASVLPFEEQFEAGLASGAVVFSFTFGLPPEHALAAIKDRGMLLVATATTIEEAVTLERAGCDVIVAQGSEAGGHRGTFAAAFEQAMVGTMALVPQMVDAVSVPVIASGGIMDGRGLVAALALGAQAVQMGTAFLTCDEAGVADAYKAAIVEASARETKITRAFSGRPARGIVNRFMSEVEPDGSLDAVLPFPLQNALTRPLRTAAAMQGRAEFLSLWAGQGLTLARRQGAAALMARLVADAEQTLRRLSG